MPLKILPAADLGAHKEEKTYPTGQAAADNLEPLAVGDGRNSRRCTQLANLQFAAVVSRRYFRPAEDDAYRDIQPLVAEEALLNAEADIHTGPIGGYSILQLHGHYPSNRGALVTAF